ncbi:hypothetical protein ACTXT7_013013 [Hymenolepis weldensis]
MVNDTSNQQLRGASHCVQGRYEMGQAKNIFNKEARNTFGVPEMLYLMFVQVHPDFYNCLSRKKTTLYP